MSTAHSMPSAARSNATKKPSPVWSTSSPPCAAKAERSSRSCQRRSSLQASSPIRPTRSVEVTMSVNMNVRRSPGRPVAAGRRAPPGAPRRAAHRPAAGRASRRAARTPPAPRAGRAERPPASPSAASASAYRSRARALSYGRSVACHSRHDWPSTRRRLPTACPRRGAARRARVIAPASEQRPLEVAGDRLELLDGRPGRLQVAGGEAMSTWAGSRRPRVVRSAALPSAGRRRERALDRAARIGDLASRELQERQPGLASWPYSYARSKASAAASRSPIRSRTSPIWYCA